jgi:hypothetical protein
MGGILRIEPDKVLKICEAYEGYGACLLDFEKVLALENIVYPLIIKAQDIERASKKKGK